MDKRLLDILCCPVSKTPVALLAKPQLDALNDAIRAGGVLTVGGAVVSESIEAGLITTDSRLIYRIEDEIPVMLADDGIGTNQFRDFPRR